MDRVDVGVCLQVGDGEEFVKKVVSVLDKGCQFMN